MWFVTNSFIDWELQQNFLPTTKWICVKGFLWLPEPPHLAQQKLLALTDLEISRRSICSRSYRSFSLTTCSRLALTSVICLWVFDREKQVCAWVVGGGWLREFERKCTLEWQTYYKTNSLDLGLNCNL